MMNPTRTPIPVEAGGLDILVTGNRVSLAARDRLFGRSCLVSLSPEGAKALRALLDTLEAPQGQEVRA